ncbi:MAG: hypothetical protein ACP5L0_02925 [Caldisphaera sp.]|jgi:hypothetical protein|uniref:hypothetical protein n=1 Tax=Caldisphaera sp. TaxID=2060322 RepID=UPI000CAD4745|nr:MAG: hypothetical protein C0202_00675 [Caldisphaera sp.]
MGASSEGAKANKEIKNILIKLLENYGEFFSRDERLNSDGIRLYKRVSYFLHLIDNKTLVNLYKKSFRNPTIENIIEFAKYFIDAEDIKISTLNNIYYEEMFEFNDVNV